MLGKLPRIHSTALILPTGEGLLERDQRGDIETFPDRGFPGRNRIHRSGPGFHYDDVTEEVVQIDVAQIDGSHEGNLSNIATSNNKVGNLLTLHPVHIRDLVLRGTHPVGARCLVTAGGGCSSSFGRGGLFVDNGQLVPLHLFHLGRGANKGRSHPVAATVRCGGASIGYRSVGLAVAFFALDGGAGVETHAL